MSRRTGARIGQADRPQSKESVGAWKKCPGPQRGLHLGHHLGERKTRILSACGLAGVKQRKTYVLPRETPGLARVGKGIDPQFTDEENLAHSAKGHIASQV